MRAESHLKSFIFFVYKYIDISRITMGKTDKKEKVVEEEAEVESGDDYEQKLQFVNEIAKPMANKKLVKKLFKCIKKGNTIYLKESQLI